MAVKFTNNARTTLAADITNSATTATVTSGAVFPELNAGEYFYCTFDNGTNNEIVKVTARSGNTLTIVRGVDNSTARAFVADDAAELRATAGLLTDIQENLAAKSANQTIYNATTASNATAYDIGIDPGQESNAMVFLNGVMQHHDTFSFSSSTLTFDTAPVNGTALEVIVDNLINLQSSNLTTDTFTATSGQTAFVLSDAPAAENNLIVFIDGVFQDQSNYSISDHTLTLATGAVQGRTVTIYIINPVNIGTPSDGTVTTSKLSGNITMPGTLTVGAFDVAFDSPTFFVDNSNSRVGLGTATPSVPVDIVGEVKISSHLNMPDNAKAKFGTGSDLQIYHNGSNSFIDDTGTGSLFVRADATIAIKSLAQDEFYIKCVENDTVELYNNGSKKLATTATGIDVTGGIHATSASSGGTASGNADELILEGSGNTGLTILSGATALGNLFFADSGDAADGYIQYDQNGRSMRFGTATAERLRIDSSGNVGIGSGSPVSYNSAARNLVIKDTGNVGITIAAEGGGDSTLMFADGTGGTAGYRGRVAYSHAADRMEFHTAAAERMRITSAGAVGIGTTSPSTTLHVTSPAASNKSVIITRSSGAEAVNLSEMQDYNALQILNKSSGSYLNFAGNASHTSIQAQSNGSTAEDIALNPYGGNVGIGTTSPSAKLDIKMSDANGAYGRGIDGNLNLENTNTSVTEGGWLSISGYMGNAAQSGQYQMGAITGGKQTTAADGTYGGYLSLWTTSGGGNGEANSGMYERARIDSSGNLLVGKTSTSFSTAGASLYASGDNDFVNNSNVLSLNRLSSDGSIITFYKDSSVVGKINVEGSELAIGHTTAGLQFLGSEARIRPFNISNNAATDNTIDLGRSNSRFQDIYATNGTINTSDRNEKQDIETLTDAETRVAVAAKGLLRKFKWKSAVKEKSDDARIHFGIIAQDLQDAFTAEGLDASDYAMFISDTWTDDDGNEQTRLGVRYSELLAFIIAAI